jgi:hypothetical protein
VDHALAAEAQDSERLDERGVRLLADDDGDRRRAEEPVGLHVPAGVAQDGVAAAGERRHVGNRRAGDEARGGPRRQAEDVDEPAERDPFELGGHRRDGVQAAVLVPCRGEPAGRDRDRQRAAHDESEEAGTADGESGRRAHLVEQPQYLAGVARAVGQRLVPTGDAAYGGGLRGDASLALGFEVALGTRGGVAQQLAPSMCGSFRSVHAASTVRRFSPRRGRTPCLGR